MSWIQSICIQIIFNVLTGRFHPYRPKCIITFPPSPLWVCVGLCARSVILFSFFTSNIYVTVAVNPYDVTQRSSGVRVHIDEIQISKFHQPILYWHKTAYANLKPNSTMPRIVFPEVIYESLEKICIYKNSWHKKIYDFIMGYTDIQTYQFLTTSVLIRTRITSYYSQYQRRVEF